MGEAVFEIWTVKFKWQNLSGKKHVIKKEMHVEQAMISLQRMADESGKTCNENWMPGQNLENKSLL